MLLFILKHHCMEPTNTSQVHMHVHMRHAGRGRSHKALFPESPNMGTNQCE